MRRIALTLLATSVMLGRADAQAVKWEPERTTPGWVFTPGLVLGGGWDSNVTVQSKGDPHLREWIGLVNPRGEIDFNGRRTHLNGGYSGALEAYRRFGELQRYEQRGKLEAKHDLSSRLLVGGNATYAAVPTTDRLELGGGAIPFVDVGSELLDLAARLQVRAGMRTRIEGEYAFQHVRFDETKAELSSEFLRGGYSQEPGLRVIHEVTSRLSVTGAWSYRHANLQQGQQLFDVQNGGGEVSYRVSSTTTVTGGLGASRLRVSNIELTKWGPTLRGSIEQKAGRTLLSARYERAFVPSFGFGGLTANQALSANAHVPFSAGRYYVDGGLSYGRTQPVKELGIGFQLDSIWASASFGYHVSRWLRTEAFFSSSHQNSTARGDIDRTRIGVQFITSKPVRIQ